MILYAGMYAMAAVLLAQILFERRDLGSLVKDALERAAQDANDSDYDIGW